MTSDDRPTLDYHRGPPPPNAVAQCIGAAVLTVVLILGGVFAYILLLFAMSYGRAHDTLALLVTAVVGVGVLVGANVLAYRAYRNPRRRGIGLGIWIGLGVAMLIEGACFAGKFN